MPTTRMVPEIYATPQIAMAAAAVGDVISIKAGTSWANVLTINKSVAVVGRTTTPHLNAPVIGTGHFLAGSLVVNTSGLVLLEGVRIAYNGNAWPPIRISATCLLNRCVIDEQYRGDAFLVGYGGQPTLEIRNCQFKAGGQYDDELLYNYSANAVAVMSGTVLPAVPNAYSLARFAAIDYRTSAAVGYGPAYGSWYIGQWGGPTYAISGLLRLGSGVDPTTAKLYLWRKLSGVGIENSPWLSTVPAPSDGNGYGAWRFDYLPTDHTYYVGIVTPSGHESKLLGPYVPAQG